VAVNGRRGMQGSCAPGPVGATLPLKGQDFLQNFTSKRDWPVCAIEAFLPVILVYSVHRATCQACRICFPFFSSHTISQSPSPKSLAFQRRRHANSIYPIHLRSLPSPSFIRLCLAIFIFVVSSKDSLAFAIALHLARPVVAVPNLKALNDLG
jgi:hypothetical protein